MKTRAARVVGVLALGLFGACTSKGAEKILTETDHGGTVDVAAGEAFDIVLEGNPTTGYQWAADSADPAVVESLSEPEFQPSGAALGAGGKYVFRFRAVAPGRVQLRLRYFRSFEPDNPPAKTFEVTINVP
jgi:inhibitor of cysteine peptidase